MINIVVLMEGIVLGNILDSLIELIILEIEIEREREC